MDTNDRGAIVDLLVSLAAILDERRWDDLGLAFTEDAVAYRDGNTGLEAIERGIRSNLGGCGPSQHLLGNHRVEVVGDTARAVTAVRVLHQGDGDRAAATFECLGDYHDELVRTAAGWRISHRRFDVRMALGDRAVLRPG
jgi:3-phenylpropionate/cinnamic acid dioxygenase small subunit